MKIIILAVNILILQQLTAIAQPSSNLIKDWKSAQVKLARGFEDNPDNPISGSELFKKLKATQDQQIFLEMAAQAEYPMVAMAGFLCLKEQDSKQAIGVAMRILLETGNPASELNAPMIKFLGEQQDTEEMRVALTEVCQTGQYHLTNFQVLLLKIPYNILYDWYQAQRRPPLSATAEAAILDGLIGEAKEHGKPVSLEMTAALDKLRFAPGFPRAIFVLYAKSDEETMRSNMKLVLEDESISFPTLVVLVLNKPKLVEEALLNDKSISEERRNRIRRLLSKRKQNR